MKKRRDGIAILVVMVFAFSIATILFFMAFSNTNLAYQNRQTLNQMQAYYLAQSGMQHAKLKLRLLPKEVYDYFKPSSGVSVSSDYTLNDLDSSYYPPLDLGKYSPSMGKYDLFDPKNSADKASPYGGKYRVEKFQLQGSYGQKSTGGGSIKVTKMVHDNYFIEVFSEINSGGPKKSYEMRHNEEVTVTRFTGGI